MNIYKNEIFELLNKYILLHGIKPNKNELINIDDNIYDMIIKFDNWIYRAEDFARGDGRDYIAYLNINKNFINNIYPKYIENNNIENNNFIKHIIYKITSGVKGTQFIYPDLIFNIINIKIENEIMYFNLNDLNGNILKSENDLINFELKDNNINLYHYIYDIIKLNNKLLYKLYQLKILYNDNLLHPNVKLNYFLI